MSVQTQLDRLNGLRVNCVDAVTQMGGTISNTAKYEDVPAAIKTIKGIANAVPTLPTANGIETQIARKKAITDACKQMIIASGGTMPNIAKMADVPTGILSIPKGAEASTSPKIGVEYSVGIADLTPDVISIFAHAISNNNKITETTEIVYVDYSDIHRKISVANQVTIPLNGTSYNFDVIGFNHDKLTNPAAYGENTLTGKSGITFQLHTPYAGANYQMNRKSTNKGGWSQSLMRNSTMATMKSYMPEEWQSVTKLVDKISGTGGAGNDNNIQISSDGCFLLAEGEVSGTHEYSSKKEYSQVVQYAYYKSGRSPKKSERCWLRSPHYEDAFGRVLDFCALNLLQYDSVIITKDSNVYLAIAFAFCV